MTVKERKIQERALELWQIHEDWCEWKAQSVAVREYLPEQKQKTKIVLIVY